MGVMKGHLLLFAAIAAEVVATLSLRASVEHRSWVTVVVVGYLAAFVLLGLTLRAGMPVGVVYGIWGAAGVALVAILGAVLFGETLSVSAVAGLALIVVGVVVVEYGSRPAVAGESAE